MFSGTFRKFKEKMLAQNPTALDNKVSLQYYLIFGTLYSFNNIN